MKHINRTKINLAFLLSYFILMIGFQSLSAQENKLDAPLMKGKNILIVYGGWPGHSPKEFVAKIQPWLEAEGAHVTLSDSLGIYTNVEFLKSQDLIIQSWTMGEITKPQRDGLLTAVKSGVGFAGCHGGTGDSFRKTVEFQYLVGCHWVAHPGGQIDYAVEMTDEKDDITKGLSDFNVHSEQYYILVDPNIKVLATTTFTGDTDQWINGAVIPVIWKKYFDKGRVFYYSVGHDMKEYDIPESWTIVQRGFRWASESKYQAAEDWLRPVYQK